MTEILALLQAIAPLLPKTTLGQMSHVMSSLGSWSSADGSRCWGFHAGRRKSSSYRTIQRFYYTKLPWIAIHWLFFRMKFLKPNDAYIAAGDESVASKAGKAIYGLDRFFSGIQQRVIPGLSFFTCSLVNVREERSYPMLVA